MSEQAYDFAKSMYEEYCLLGSQRNELGWPKCSWDVLGTQQRLIWADAAKAALRRLYRVAPPLEKAVRDLVEAGTPEDLYDGGGESYSLTELFAAWEAANE